MCRALGQDPIPARLFALYSWQKADGWYNLVPRRKMAKISVKAPKSMHDWKFSFFYINAGVFPEPMERLHGKLKELSLPPFERQDWYRELIKYEVPFQSFPEGAMVILGMSRVWDNKSLRPVIFSDGKVRSSWERLLHAAMEQKDTTGVEPRGSRHLYPLMAQSALFHIPVVGLGGNLIMHDANFDLPVTPPSEPEVQETGHGGKVGQGGAGKGKAPKATGPK